MGRTVAFGMIRNGHLATRLSIGHLRVYATTEMNRVDEHLASCNVTKHCGRDKVVAYCTQARAGTAT